MLNGSCELGEDGSPAFERLDRGQRLPASAVSGERADLGSRPRPFSCLLLRRRSRPLPCLRMAAFSGITL